MIRRAIVLTLGDIGLTADARMRWFLEFFCEVIRLDIEPRNRGDDYSCLFDTTSIVGRW